MLYRSELLRQLKFITYVSRQILKVALRWFLLLFKQVIMRLFNISCKQEGYFLSNDSEYRPGVVYETESIGEDVVIVIQ